MEAIKGDLRTKRFVSAVSRRTALRGLGGASLAALAIAVPGRVGASDGDRIANALFAPVSRDDPAAVIKDYVAAVNAGDLDGILALYADDAVHIFLPTADARPGSVWARTSSACGTSRAWPTATRSNSRTAPSPLTATRPRSSPTSRVNHGPSSGWRRWKPDTEMVLIDGRIMTHVVVLTPESVRKLQAARGSAMDATNGSLSNPLMNVSQTGETWAAPPM